MNNSYEKRTDHQSNYDRTSGPSIKHWFFPEHKVNDYNDLSKELLTLIGKKHVYLFASIHAPRLIDRVYLVKDRLEKEYGVRGIVVAQAVYRYNRGYHMMIVVDVNKDYFINALKCLDRFSLWAFMICSDRVDSADYERWSIIREHEHSTVYQGYEDIELDNESCIYMLDWDGGTNVYYMDAASNN